MLAKFALKLSPFKQYPTPLAGDWLVIIVSAIVVIVLFLKLWNNAPASRIKISSGKQVVGIFDLNQQRDLIIKGAIGESRVSINQGKVRFKQSPCNSQYCVHQGWLSHAGQAAICLPNQISLQLLGAKAPYDTLNY